MSRVLIVALWLVAAGAGFWLGAGAALDTGDHVQWTGLQ